MEKKTVKGKSERTRQALKDAFMELYSKTELSKISVKEITEKAGVTRSTFYAYFESVYDLLEQIEKELEDGLGPYFDRYNQHKFKEGYVENSDSTLNWFHYCMDNKDYLVTLMGPHGDPAFEYRIRKKLKEDVAVMMSNDGFPEDELREYFVEYTVSATLAMVRYWLENGDNVSPEKILIVANMMREGAIIRNMYKSGKED